jgi:SCY1-like protein 2
MGSALSQNFDQIEPLFTSGFWKVNSAIHKYSPTRVSLWIFDRKSARAAATSTAQFDRYITAVTQSITQMRRLHHPHVLKVLAVPDSPSDLFFVAEEISGTLASDATLTADDITYVADQILETLNFLHGNALLMVLTLTPDSVAITNALQIKLCDFTFATPLAQDFGYTPYCVSPLFPNLHFSAPEILLNEIVSPAADVFSWAAILAFCFGKGPFFDSRTVEDQLRQIQERALPVMSTDELQESVSQALRIDPFCRPSLNELIQSKSFLQVSIRALRFIDTILTKTPANRFTFYSNLLPSLPLFSDRLLRRKLAPLFVNQLKGDERYGPALVPLLIHIAARFDDAAFSSAIPALQHLLCRTTPDEQAIANLSVAPLIAQRGGASEQREVLQPLFVSALQSGSVRVRTEALTRLPAVVAALSEQALLTALIPALATSIEGTEDASACCAAIECLGHCLATAPPDEFCERVCPSLSKCWRRMARPEIAAAIERLLTLLKPSARAICRFVVPLATGVLAARVADQAIGKALVVIVEHAMDSVIDQRRLAERAAKWIPLQQPEEEPMIPVPVRITPRPSSEERKSEDEKKPEEKPALFSGMSLGSVKRKGSRP